MYLNCSHCDKDLDQSSEELVTYPINAIIVQDATPRSRLVFCDWKCLGQFSALKEAE